MLNLILLKVIMEVILYENIKLTVHNKKLLLDFVGSARKFCDIFMPKKCYKRIVIKQSDVKYNRWIQLPQKNYYICFTKVFI